MNKDPAPVVIQGMTCPEAVSVAAYLLGALQPDETASTRSHLAACEDCRDELMDIAPVLGWLRRHLAHGAPR